MLLKSAIVYMLFFASLSASMASRAELPKDAVWIDVRTPGEYSQGHLQQAQSIPFDSIEAGIARLRLPKDTPIYLYCAAGGRAEAAKQRLEAIDYRNVTNVGSLENARQIAAEDSR